MYHIACIETRVIRVVITPTGEPYHGVELDSKLCAVSIIRGGGCLEAPLKEILEVSFIHEVMIN